MLTQPDITTVAQNSFAVTRVAESMEHGVTRGDVSLPVADVQVRTALEEFLRSVLPFFPLDEIERWRTEGALRATNGSRRAAAQLLGCSRRTTYAKVPATKVVR